MRLGDPSTRYLFFVNTVRAINWNDIVEVPMGDMVKIDIILDSLALYLI